MGAIALGVKPLDVVNLWMPRELFAPSPLAQIWELGGTRFEAQAAPLLKYGGGVTNVFTRGPLAYAHLLIHHHARGCSTNHSRLAQANTILRFVPVVNLMLRISNFGHHPYMMALNRELDWKRYFAYSIRSDQWLYSTAGNAGSSQDDAYFSEHPTPFFRRNTSNLFSQAFNECNGQPEPIWLASLCW